jgi:hypothetical protein
MSAGTIAAIVVVVIIVAALIAGASLAARRRRLRERFGPEYDRVVEGSDSRRRAEAELASREKRVRQLDIQPLDPAARAAYQGQWTTIQQQFVDTPSEAVAAAQTLITGVMADRGYPVEDSSQIIDDLSVDHAATIGRLRTAQDISARAADGTASTEDLRQAMIHYRALFDELVGDPAEVPHDATEPVAAVDAAPVDSAPVDTAPVDTAPVDTVAPATPADVPAADPIVTDDDMTEYDTPDRLDADRDMADGDTVGRHRASLDEPDLTQPDLDEPDLDNQPEPAAASRLPWRK